MTEKLLDSGIWLAEAEPPPPPVVPTPDVPPAEGLRCVACGKQSRDSQVMPLSWRTTDGFLTPWPACGHGRYIKCPGCKWEGGCPVCGEQEEYT